ncbi:MAG: hypothetical protein L3J13_09035 [Devosiaceae bacterium]|nr:hypothetical protein [Devosiaceae bacterium]
MSAVLLRLLIYGVIIGAIYFGIRRIINDWKKQFRADDAAIRERDLKERKRPDVVELKKDKDGVFRPGDEDKK